MAVYAILTAALTLLVASVLYQGQLDTVRRIEATAQDILGFLTEHGQEEVQAQRQHIYVMGCFLVEPEQTQTPDLMRTCLDEAEVITADTDIAALLVDNRQERSQEGGP